MNKTILSACAIAAIVAPAFAGEGWSTDLPAALEQAAKENKAVMVDFNGSDWCGPCKMLKSKVFDTPEFAAYAKDKFILVDIDLPKGDKISEEQKKINNALAEKYAVSGFPTILVLSKDGAVLGGFVGGTDQLSEVTASLDAALANAPAVNAAMDKAAGLKGAAKAKALFEAYQLAPADVQAHNTALKAEIVANDPEDTLGLTAAEKAEAERADAESAVVAMIDGKQPAEIKAIFKAEMKKKDLPAAQRAFMEMILLQFVMLDCKTKADLNKFFAKAEKFVKANPAYAGDIGGMVEELKAMELTELLESLKAAREAEEAAAE